MREVHFFLHFLSRPLNLAPGSLVPDETIGDLDPRSWAVGYWPKSARI